MIDDFRRELDKIDDKISQLLLDRLSFVKKIGEEKKRIAKPVLDSKREREIRERLLKTCETEDERNYLLNIYESIMTESKKVQ